MAMQEWIHKYPGVAKLLEDEGDTLLFPAVDETRAPASRETPCRIDHYILDGTMPRPCEDRLVWWQWFTTADRHAGDTWFGEPDAEDAVRVSTIFVGLDHQCERGGPPLLWETKIFGLDEDICAYYSTWEEAEAGHARWCAYVQARSQLSGRETGEETTHVDGE